MAKSYRVDILLLLCVYSAIAIGVLTLYAQDALLVHSSERWFKQLIYAAIGTVFLLALSKLNYQYFSLYCIYIYIFSILLLAVTLIPGIGSEIKGARSWIRIGELINFQSSELAKLATIVLLASYLALKEREMTQLSSLIIPFAIVLVPSALILVQPDFGSAFSLLPVLFALLFLAGADIYHVCAIMTYAFLSLFIPLYVKYHNITLLPALMDYLEELQKTDLLVAVRILKTDIWSYVRNMEIPVKVAEQDHAYLSRVLQSESLMSAFQDSIAVVRYEAGGLLLVLLENLNFLMIAGALMLFTALVLLGFRMAYGISYKKLRRFYIPLGILGLSLITASAIQSYFSFRYHQVARITAFINPEQFPRDLAYQIRASKAAIGSGELTGRGLWQGEMTIGRRPLVPEAYTDFIFTAWAERTGFLGGVLLLLLLLAVPARALIISFEARERFGALLAGGIAFLYIFHITVNIGIGLGLLPVTGLPLSFVSYGGSHLLICMCAAGMLLNIYRRKFAN